VTLRRRYYREMNLLPVPVNGSVARGLRAGYYAIRLRDGRSAMSSAALMIAFKAAIASCLQIPMHEVPHLQVNQQLDVGKEPEEVEQATDEALSRWLTEQGVRLVVHSGHLPTTGRWIGVVRGPVRGEFARRPLPGDTRPDCLFETSKPVGEFDRAVRFGYEDVDYGITIE
jgi:hypothetical protein